jgi:polysaccharide deacetylase family protein (PEP-CTERM system associated)
MLNALTIDVEDWFHSLDPEPSHWPRYEDRIVASTRHVLAILAANGARGTFFVLSWIAERHPELIRAIHHEGHEVASHGAEHRFVYAQDPRAFESDLVRSLDVLEGIVRRPIRGYRAPYFSITRRSLWALPILARHGVQYDSSIFPVWNHRYGIPDAPRLVHRTEGGLTEVPVSTLPLAGANLPCCGGAYFRILPFRLLQGMYRRLNQRGEPFVFYLHPWELDADQPRLGVGRGLRLRHYWGLAQVAAKLEALVRQFRFGTIQEVFHV